ncbi:uncharacterized protein LOC130656912 [Hydractinia symbiolongicarpus]|uniref:uncharacterized protein LOC130656912 n=1 Tax=Hydractinia symbiolongicarpus TaxID=13093 RepID=UPI00254A58C9|nr:uncharacterized protein LOC130656912 [Hydractinia symbiolongicarpus]
MKNYNDKNMGRKKQALFIIILVIGLTLIITFVRKYQKLELEGMTIDIRKYEYASNNIVFNHSILETIRKRLTLLRRTINTVKLLKTRETENLVNLHKPVRELVRNGRNPENIILATPRLPPQSATKVIILVLSDTNNFHARKLIRSTWAKIKTLKLPGNKTVLLKWKVFFSVGYKQVKGFDWIEHESIFQQDLIVTDLVDSPVTTTMKIMTSLRWLQNSCVFDYVFVIKDNMFVNMAGLYDFIHSADKPSKGLYAGRINFKHKLTHLSEIKNMNTYYPRHAEGDLFIMSSDVVKKVLTFFNETQSKSMRSDVYIGQLVLKSGFDVWNIADLIIPFCVHSRMNIINVLNYDTTKDCMEYLYRIITL